MYIIVYTVIPTVVKTREEKIVEKEKARLCYVYCAGDASLSVGNMELIKKTEAQTNKSSCTDT